MAHVYNAHDLNLQPPKDKKPKRKAKAAKKPDTSRPKSAPKAVAKTVAKAKAKAGAKAGVKEKSKKVKKANQDDEPALEHPPTKRKDDEPTVQEKQPKKTKKNTPAPVPETPGTLDTMTEKPRASRVRKPPVAQEPMEPVTSLESKRAKIGDGGAAVNPLPPLPGPSPSPAPTANEESQSQSQQTTWYLGCNQGY